MKKSLFIITSLFALALYALTFTGCSNLGWQDSASLSVNLPKALFSTVHLSDDVIDLDELDFTYIAELTAFNDTYSVTASRNINYLDDSDETTFTLTLDNVRAGETVKIRLILKAESDEFSAYAGAGFSESFTVKAGKNETSLTVYQATCYVDANYNSSVKTFANVTKTFGEAYTLCVESADPDEPEEGIKIALVSNATLDAPIQVEERDLVADLNGFTLTRTQPSEDETPYIQNMGKTITVRNGIIDGANIPFEIPLFYNNNGLLNLTNLTVQNVSSELTDVKIENNTMSENGFSVLYQGGGETHITNCVIQNNTAAWSTVDLRQYGYTVISGTTFQNNKGLYTDIINFGEVILTDGTVIKDCDYADDYKFEDGGSIYASTILNKGTFVMCGADITGYLLSYGTFEMVDTYQHSNNNQEIDGDFKTDSNKITKDPTDGRSTSRYALELDAGSLILDKNAVITGQTLVTPNATVALRTKEFTNTPVTQIGLQSDLGVITLNLSGVSGSTTSTRGYIVDFPFTTLTNAQYPTDLVAYSLSEDELNSYFPVSNGKWLKIASSERFTVKPYTGSSFADSVTISAPLVAVPKSYEYSTDNTNVIYNFPSN